MSDLVTIETDKYDLVIWAKDVERSRSRLVKTLEARGKKPKPSSVLAVPAVLLKNCDKETGQIDIEEAVFFENKQYDIEFIFDESIKESLAHSHPKVEHRLSIIEEAFHYSHRTNSLRATISTGNDIGWFKFELVYRLEGKIVRQKYSIEILPTKMDMAEDFQVMNSAIDQEFPLWRFSLAEKTEHQMRRSKEPHPDFLLLWLAQFESLLAEFNRGLNYIVSAPHSRLIPLERLVKLEKLKGKFSPKLEQQIAHARADKNLERYFKPQKKILSVDTPENRFIKSVILTAISKLTEIDRVSRKAQLEPDKHRLSNSFFANLDRWKKDMVFFQKKGFFREVGTYSGLKKESMVLQQKPGYAKVYKAWQQLKWYLELFKGNSRLSLRSIAELYEIWCFLEIRKIILDLGFEKLESKRIPMIDEGIKASFKDGMAGSFRFSRVDGIRLRLAHEPRFTQSGTAIRSWTTAQKPDIFLEASFPNGDRVVWLFDAKYRIKESRDSYEDYDEVPDDAINQMHRYRDALIHIEKHAGYETGKKTRPVFGAFALYPGFFNQLEEENPYSSQIEQVGIGAFSLLPTSDGSGSLWLGSFLTEKFSQISSNYVEASSDKHFIEEAPRIAYQGTEVTRFNDLVIAANQLGPSRAEEYITRFENGEARFYHTRQFAFERQSVERHVINEARYFAVALDSVEDSREIAYVYPILKSSMVLRGNMTPEQTGTDEISDPDEIYWLFELGSSLQLNKKLFVPNEHNFKIKLLEREELSSSNSWEELSERYSSIIEITESNIQ